VGVRTAAGLTAGGRAEALIVAVLSAALVGYAALALGLAHWWISGSAALVVAGLLFARHRRARFSAYVLLSVVALRGTVTGHWAALTFAAAAILLLQSPPALRAWPRLGHRRSDASTDDADCPRMARP
jgi:hypothetical protein